MSELFKLNSRDFIKGLVLFVVVAVLKTLLDMLGGGFENVDLMSLANTATTATVSYLLIKLGTDADGKIAGRI